MIGIVAGVLVFSFYKPEKHVIVQYPHPSDAATKVFRDKNTSCYTYSSHEVNCDANEGTLKEYPIQG
jgi:hypothetical protein